MTPQPADFTHPKTEQTFESHEFEVFRNNDTVYALSREHLLRIDIDSGEQASEQDILHESLALASGNWLDPHIVIVDPPQAVASYYERHSYTIIDSEEFSNLIWPKDSRLALVVFCGDPIELPPDYRINPTVIWASQLSRHIRSSIGWSGSARPCFDCVSALYHDGASDGTGELFEASLAMHKKGVSPKRGASLPTVPELFTYVDEATKLSKSIKLDRQWAIDSLRYCYVRDLISGRVTREIYPMDPSCTHRRFWLEQ